MNFELVCRIKPDGSKQVTSATSGRKPRLSPQKWKQKSPQSRLSPSPRRFSPKKPSPKKKGNAAISAGQVQMTTTINGESILTLLSNPVKSTLVNQYIKSDGDIKKYQENMFPDCEQFQFDKIIGSSVKQKQMYSMLFQQSVNEVFQNKSYVFLLSGPSSTGKRYIIKGVDNNAEEKGSLFLAAQDLLNLINLQKQSKNEDKLKLFLSIFTIFDNQMNDLLFTKNTDYETTSQEIKVPTDITTIYNKVFKNEKRNPDMNLFFNLFIKQNQNKLGSIMFAIIPYQSLQYLPPKETKSSTLIQSALSSTLKNANLVQLIICITQNASIDTVNYLRYALKIREKFVVDLPKLQVNTENLVQQCFDFQNQIQNVPMEQRVEWVNQMINQCSEMLNQMEAISVTQEEKVTQKNSLLKLTETLKFLSDLKNKLSNDGPKRKIPFENTENQSFQKSKKNKQKNQSLEVEELKEYTNKQQLKLLKKNEEISSLKEENIELKSAFQEEKKLFQSQKNELERQVDILKSQMYAYNLEINNLFSNQERNNNIQQQIQIEKLTSLLDHTSKVKMHFENTNEHSSAKMNSILNMENTELNTECQRLRQENQSLSNKVMNNEEFIQDLEKKNQKLKRKMDQLVKVQLEEKIQDSQKNQNKSKDLYKVVEELESKLQKLVIESQEMKEENLNLKEEKQDSKRQINKLKQSLNDLEEQKNKFLFEKKELEQKLELLKKDINDTKYNLIANEEEKKQLANDSMREGQAYKKLKKQYDECEDIIKELKNDNQILCEELRYHKELLEKMEKQNHMISEVQNKEFDQLENKLDKITREIVQQREENERLKRNERKLLDELEEYSRNTEFLTNNLSEQKIKNKLLSKQVEEIDGKLRDLISEKQNEIVSLNRPTSSYYANQGVGRKLKSLENLENLIKKQRKSKSKIESDSSLSD